ncbi:hypothetical protein B0H14DRAFT_2345701, partial [Mycena olivaceomarginata]
QSGAYGFTDYRSLGQTIGHVLVDLASPPSGKLSLFNFMLRSTGVLVHDYTFRLSIPRSSCVNDFSVYCSLAGISLHFNL